MKVAKWIQYTMDLVDDPRTDTNDVWDAVVHDIIKHQYCFDAQYHQYGSNGVPVIEFDDGTQLPSLYTQRVWGRLMAEAWNKMTNQNYSYMDFYWGLPAGVDAKFPTNKL